MCGQARTCAEVGGQPSAMQVPGMELRLSAGGKSLYPLSHLAGPRVDFTAYSLTLQNFEMTLGTHSLADDVTIWTGLTEISLLTIVSCMFLLTLAFVSETHPAPLLIKSMFFIQS